MSETNDALITFLIRQGDDNVVLGQRLGELVSYMPELEEDIAVANVGLDHIGAARNCYSYAADLEGEGKTEDDLAMLRDERAYTNAVLAEQPNGDFAHMMARQFFYDAYQVPLYVALVDSTDERLSGIAQKGLKESTYHLRRSAGWIVRLGDGTLESHERMQLAIDELWKYTADLFYTDLVDEELELAGILPNLAGVRAEFDRTVGEVLAAATLEMPEDDYQRLGGRTGFHTEHLGHLLSEMQSLHRSYPGVKW